MIALDEKNVMEEMLGLPEPSDASCRRARRSLDETLRPLRSYCGWVDGPMGRLYVARTDKGLCRISFKQREDDFLHELECCGSIPELDARRVEPIRRQLEEYFDGKRRRFRLALDPVWVSEFQAAVLASARRIPFGATASYSDIARDIGKPRASRAVGNALGKNPVAIVIPCHRVITADGSLGGYTGGTHIKRLLMGIEGIEIEEDAS